MTKLKSNPISRKTKVLVVPSDRTGVGYFRSTKPHIVLETNFPDEFHIDIDYEPQLNNDEWLKQYDVIHYHRTLGPYEQMPMLLERLDKLGIITIMDLDDYWSPGVHHPAYHLIKNSELDKKIVGNLKIARNITTTTTLFADEIKKLNKNVFVLPNAIDPTEKQFTPNLEKSDRIRIGWLGGSCMTPDTEILTDNGWKRFDTLDQTEKVATLNPETNNLEYHKPKGYICEPFEGNLNCGKNGLIEYEVTPNHNMYVSEVKSLTHKNLKLDLIMSEKIHGKNFHVKRDCNWQGLEKEMFVLPSLNFDLEYSDESSIDSIINKKSKRINNMFDKYGSDREINMDSWLEFFGFWVAEGWTTNSKGLHQVGVAQVKNNGTLDHMFKLLTDFGFKPTYTKDKTQVRVFDKQLWSYLSQFGTASEKFIPEEILSLSSRQLKIFLEWFIKGDGHIEKNKYERMRGFTSSVELANNLQELALKIGITATITNRGKRTSQIKGRPIIEQYDSLVVNFGKHPNLSPYHKGTPLVKSGDQYNRYYKGNVYCVEVENHIIYVRRNGKAMWIGNSHLKDLEILKGVVGKLRTDNLLDKVQFVLCGFDTRGTFTTIDQVTKEQKTRQITPMESVWYKYEQIFTDNYQTISPEYKEFLLKFSQDEFPTVNNEPYRRVWTKPISTYASNYNLFDISLAPIEENTFNKVKSQLKVIEGGFHHKVIIAQNFGPYKIDIKNAIQYGGGFDLTANGILIDSNKNNKDWYVAIKKLIQNPEVISVLQENLYNTVKDLYSIEKVTSDRRELYLNLIKNKKDE